MNYRHAFHAGNFADVLKHAVLALVIEHLKRKPAPFRVIDTHAGAGLYALDGPEATRTGEWMHGIGRLIGADAEPLPETAARVLAPYLTVVRGENPAAALARYPGSPLIARRLLRPGDTLIVNELHPEDGSELARLFARDAQVRVLDLDGWTALKSLLPPKERRGVVLVDPPFEQEGDLDRLVSGLREATRRFATGTYILWHPIKDERAVRRFVSALAALALPKLFRIELLIRAARNPDLLNGCGLVVLNPPFTLPGDLAHVLPLLRDRLGVAAGAEARSEWISSERA